MADKHQDEPAFLTFRWSTRGPWAEFRSEAELDDDAERFRIQLQDILKWCGSQGLKQEDFRLDARRTTLSERIDALVVKGRSTEFVEGTVFHAPRVRIEIDLPAHLGPMFAAVFAPVVGGDEAPEVFPRRCG